jgi:pimeloyl-ACP methyl ester carboxylesterase
VGELFRLWHETWTSSEFSSWSIVPLLRDIQVPTLSFQGENDEFGTIEQLRILEKEIPAQVTTAEIRNAGHTPRRENEAESMKWIKEYFSTFADNFN